MNIAIILSGGTGTRMKLSRPKQYLEVRDKPIIGYSLDLFERCERIDKIVVVCHSDWKDFVAEYARKEGISKLFAFAPSGETRQESLFNGLKACVGVAADCSAPRVTWGNDSEANNKTAGGGGGTIRSLVVYLVIGLLPLLGSVFTGLDPYIVIPAVSVAAAVVSFFLSRRFISRAARNLASFEG